MAKKDRGKALGVDDILKKYSAENNPQEYLMTGVMPIDLLTRYRGLPMGRLIQFYSESKFGKTTTMFSVCRNLAMNDIGSWYCAIEPSTQLAIDMGLMDDTKNFKLLDLQTYTELEEITNAFLASDSRLLVVDSLSSVTPSKQALGETGIEEAVIGLDARISTTYLKVYGGLLKRTDKCILYISQVRANFNAGWGSSPTKPEGGYSSQFFADMRFTMTGDAKVDNKALGHSDISSNVGKKGILSAVKNRHAVPYARIPILVFFGKGVSNRYSMEQYLRWKGAISGGGGGNYTITVGELEEKAKGKKELLEKISEMQEFILEDLKNNADEYYQALLEGVKYD